MRNFEFKDRYGQTPLPEELRKGLIPTHITTMGELDEYEEENIALGLSWLKNYTKDDCLVFDFWTRLHKELFKKVWKWAGAIRSHELDNPDFRPAHQIRPDLKALEGNVRHWLETKIYSPQEIAARFHERIETIHPFPNGNGRFGRILTEYVCERRNLPIPTWGQSLQEDSRARRKSYIDGLDGARQARKYGSLVRFMFT